jgi:group II intron reverse transcriptase/maturase
VTVHAGDGQQHQQDKSRELQRTLYLCAKKNRNRRFHAMYDRISRNDVLLRAWKEVKANKGSAGIDGVTIEDIEAYGVTAYLKVIQKDLRDSAYRPQAVKRVFIPKRDGRKRPLGIPTLKDRIVQAACRIVIEPVFEANFLPASFGFRPRRSARGAMREIRQGVAWNWCVVDADIEGFFDNLDHELLMQLVGRRISDRRVLKLIRGWLKSGVIEECKTNPTEVGTPQGGVISPLLANIYLHAMDMMWATKYAELGKLVRYADDFVIICANQWIAQKALKAIESILTRLKLRLHAGKTQLVELGHKGFDFLGYHIRKLKSRRTGKYAPFMWPSMQAMRSVREKIHALTNRRMERLALPELVSRLNRVIRGWCGYFRIGNASRKLMVQDQYLNRRLLRFLCKQGQRNKWNALRFNEWRKGCGLEHFYIPNVCGRPI